MRVMQAACIVATIDTPVTYCWGTAEDDAEVEKALKIKRAALEKALKEDKEENKKPTTNKINIGTINLPKFNFFNPKQRKP